MKFLELVNGFMILKVTAFLQEIVKIMKFIFSIRILISMIQV